MKAEQQKYKDKIYNAVYYQRNKKEIALQKKAYRKVNRNKLIIYGKGYYMDNRDKWREYHSNDHYREYNRKYRLENKDKWKLYHIKEKARFPEKIKARQTVGRKIRIKYTNCYRCNKYTKIEKHHPDYFKPLDVVFLCMVCHKSIHRGVNY